MKLNFEQEFLAAYPKYDYLLERFRDALEEGEVEWGMMTKRNLVKIREHLEGIYAPNTVATFCAVLKAFLAQFTDTDLLPCGKDYKDSLRAKKVPSEQVTLNEDEMALIDNYIPKTDAEREIKSQFMCEYYTLARASDIERFTDENIDIERGIITYVAQKTKQTAIVPLHRNFLKYYRQRGRKRTQWFYNWTMKNIARKCGITQKVKVFYHGAEKVVPKCDLIASHTARRSGATNLAKRGVPIPTIAKMMSHGQNYQMTQRYIWMDDISLDEKGAAFFK